MDASVNHPKNVEYMTPEMYNNFDNSSIEKVWKQLRYIAIPHLAHKLCPTPYIHAANYFDLLNVYVRDQRKHVAEKIWRMVKREQTFRYAAKLRDVIKISTSDITKVNDILKIMDRKISKETPDFEFTIEGTKGDVVKKYYIHAKQIHEFDLNLNLDEKTGISFDRMHPGFERAHHLLVISKIYSADSVLIQASKGDDVNEWIYDKPVPLALGCLKIKLYPNGTIKSQNPVPNSELLDIDWMHSDAPHPPNCTVLETIREGKFYNILDKTGNSDQ